MQYVFVLGKLLKEQFLYPRVRMRQLDPSHAELVVSDLGPGISPHERRLVFERFYRSTTARALPGSGLGLAIVKQVVLNHGGLLRVEDTVAGGHPPGTSIFVLLPGRPLPVSTYPTAGTEGAPGAGTDAKTDPAVPLDGDAANSRESTNVISVDSQSARAR